MKSKSRPVGLSAIALVIVACLLHLPSGADELKNWPQCDFPPDTYLSPAAMSRGEFGPVLVGYRLKKNGTAKEIVVLESPASKAVQESAIRVIAALRCKPSKEWIANGGLERQLKMNVLFQYRGGESVKAIDPEVEVISFVTEPLPKFIKH